MAININKQCTIYGTKIITYGHALTAVGSNWTQREVYFITEEELTYGYKHEGVSFYVHKRVNDECPWLQTQKQRIVIVVKY